MVPCQTHGGNVEPTPRFTPDYIASETKEILSTSLLHSSNVYTNLQCSSCYTFIR